MLASRDLLSGTARAEGGQFRHPTTAEGAHRARARQTRIIVPASFVYARQGDRSNVLSCGSLNRGSAASGWSNLQEPSHHWVKALPAAGTLIFRRVAEIERSCVLPYSQGSFRKATVHRTNTGPTMPMIPHNKNPSGIQHSSTPRTGGCRSGCGGNRGGVISE